MAELGKYNTLTVLRKLDFGFYLDGGAEGDILLPLRYAPENCKPGDKVDVFVYFDSEDRIIATTEQPYARVGEFAYLKVVSVNAVGAFVDWGLPKDLLVPFREQKQTMEEGKYYVVFIYIDTDSNRIAASAKLGQFLNLEPAGYLPGDEVDIMIIGISELGYKASIFNRHEGILYQNEVFRELSKGQKMKAYIRKVRPDGKIDLRLQKEGLEAIDQNAEMLLQILQDHNGILHISDHTPAPEINELLGMSKKLFKKAAGTLYKKKLILIEENAIRLLRS